MHELPLTFEREYWYACKKFKEENPGVLEERTRLRKERQKQQRKEARKHENQTILQQ